MLAMYVVLENYLGMVCDYPAAYEGQPGFEFLKEVPTVWDETKVMDAGVCEYISIARRKNRDWFIGTITNHAPRAISINLDFLSSGEYVAEIYSDAPDAAENPNHLVKETRVVTNKDSITIQLAGDGGQAIHLRSR
jgi:alpha-glucosidase